MDYFIVFLLVIIIFTFLSDKKLESISVLQNKIKNLNGSIDYICNEMIIINIEESFNNDIQSITEIIYNKLNNNYKKYIFIKKQNIQLSNRTIRKIIANYIKEQEKMCGFMASYEYKYINHKKIESIKEELIMAIVNYINIFSKHDISTYGVIMVKTNEIDKLVSNNKRDKKNKITLFSPSNDIKIAAPKIKSNSIVNELIQIHDSDIQMIIKSALLILVGVTVTANLVYAIYVFDIIQIITAGIMYWCYSYVLKYMYRPIGRYKVASKYLFPLFIVFYLLFQIINGIKRKTKNKKVQAS